MPRLLPPGFVAPCQPSFIKVPPAGADWLHEINHDGIRLMVRRMAVTCAQDRWLHGWAGCVIIRRCRCGPPVLPYYFDGGADHRVIVRHLARSNLVHDEQDAGDLVVMRRREFITLLGGTAVTGPLKARAQQQAVPVIGYFDFGRDSFVLEDAFRQGLAEAGYVEGRNMAIIYRSADGQYDRLLPMAADLVDRQVSVILAIRSLAPAVAARRLTATIPIVVASGGDPVKNGLAASLSHPGGKSRG